MEFHETHHPDDYHWREGPGLEPRALIRGGGIRSEANASYKVARFNLLAFGQICRRPRSPECFSNVLQLLLKFDD